MEKEIEEIERKKLLRKIDDLRTKIESNEPLPHGNQDIETLYAVEEFIDEALSSWYY